MSNKILNLVRDARIGDSTAKEVLKTIADQANDAGSGVWSSYAYIAWCIERGRSTVIEKCALLKGLGILSWERGKTNLWKIDVSKLSKLGEVWTLDLEEGSPDPGPLKVQNTDNKVQTLDPSPLEPVQEPTYISAIPEEWELELDNFLTGWKKCFPKKTQPRRSSAAAKFKTRFSHEGFRANWRNALWMTKALKWAHQEGWFKWQWFLKNDDNWAKLLDGTFDFKTSEFVAIAEKEARQRKAVASHGGDREAYKEANPGGK